jgi:hypothetical protein
MNTWYENLVVQVVAEEAAPPLMHRRVVHRYTSTNYRTDSAPATLWLSFLWISLFVTQ